MRADATRSHRATGLALAALLVASSAEAREPSRPSPSLTLLAGSSQKISHALSASRDTALLSWQLTPYSALMGGADAALVELGWPMLSLRVGFIGFVELHSERPYDLEMDGLASGLPDAGNRFWRGHLGYNLAVAFDELGERWLGPRGLVEATLGVRHESEHVSGSNSGKASNDDYSDIPHVGNFTIQDFAVRIPTGDFDVELRLQNKLFFGVHGRKYTLGPGFDAIVRWRLASWLHPFSSCFGEYLLGGQARLEGELARVPDNYLLRNLTGVILPGAAGDIQIFTSLSVGHGKGLQAFEEELLWGGGVRLVPF